MASDGAVQLDLVANAKTFPASAERGLAGVSGKLATIAKGLAGIFTAKMAINFVNDCASIAAAAQDTANRVNTVFPEMAESVNSFASTAIEKMGMTAGAAKNMTAKFGLMAQGMGYSEQASAAMGEQMTALAGDIAAFYGTTTDEAMSKLTGVFTGMTRGFKQLGVNMSESNLQAHALSLGITTEVSAMSDAELAALRLSYAQSQLSKIQGYAEAHTQTYNGQVQMLQQRFTALKAALGKSFAVAMLPVIRALNAIVIAATNAANAFNSLIESLTGRKFSEILGGAQGAILDLDETTEDAANSTSSLTDAQTAAAEAAKEQQQAQDKLNRTLAGFDKINKLSSNSDALGTTAGSTVVSVVPSMDMTAWDNYSEAVSKQLDNKLTISPKLKKALEDIGRTFERLGRDIKDALGWVWENILQPLGEWTLNEAAPRVVELLNNALETLLIIGEKLAPVLDFIWNEVFRPVFEFIGDVALDLLDALNISWGDLNDLLEEADFSELIDALKEFKKTNPNMFYLIAGAITAIALALTGHPILALITALAFAGKVIYDNWDGIAEFFQNIGDSIYKAFDKAGGWIAEKFETAADNVKRAWKDIGNWFDRKRAEITIAFLNIGIWFKNKFQEARTNIQNVWQNIGSWFSQRKTDITNAFSNIGNWFSTKFKTARTNIQNAWQTISTWFANKRDAILNVFRGVPQWFGTVFGNAWNWIKSKFSGWGTFWSNLWTQVKNKFTNIGANLGSTMSYYLKAGMNGVISGVESRINWAIDLINGAIDLINRIPGVWIRWYVRRLSLPRLAQGGFVQRNSPQLAVIGDNTREGEIVAPESKLRAMAEEAAGGSDAQVVALLTQLIQVVQNIDPNTYLDGREITRNVVSNINRQTMTTGRSPILV